MAADDDIKVINDALAEFGGGAITALDEDTPLAAKVVPRFYTIRDAALAIYHWDWTKRTTLLQEVTNRALAGFSHAFQFPAGALGPPEALFVNISVPQVRLRIFSIEGDQVWCNSATLYGRFPMRIDVPLWPPAFRLAFVRWLASAYAIPVSHDANLQSQLEAQAIGSPSEGMRGGLMGRAIAMDAAGSNSRAGINVDDDLTGVHFGSGGPWYGDGQW